MAELLAELMDALEEAATEERPMRIGYEAARVLHAALLDAQAVDDKHRHSWQPLGWDRGRNGDGNVHVAQACTCGAVREATTAGAVAVSGGSE